MTEMQTLLALVLGVMAYALFARRIEASIITLPMVFTTLGWALGSGGAHLVDVEMGEALIHTIAEITLVLLLFSDASRVRLADLRRSAGIPARMLLIGMPLTLAFGTFIAGLASPEAPLAAALLVAAILTPTDAALGQALATNPNVPAHIRQAINVESGLNDGLALPVVMVAAILAVEASGGAAEGAPDNIAVFAAMQLVLGPLVGVAVGFAAAKLSDFAIDKATSSTVYQGIFSLGTAFTAFLIADMVGGNGFIAAFVAGVSFGNAMRHEAHFSHEFMESEGQLLTMFAFVVFGAVMVPLGLEHASFMTVLVAVAFLTIVRVVPIWIALTGTGLPPLEKLCLGWFGPRGLASILFALLILERFPVPGVEEILACVVLTVMLSIVAHGLTAAPLVQRFAARARQMGADKKTAPEGAAD